MELSKLLMNFNLTRQEAIIYISLTTNGEMTGYEVAKQTGISRSNIYTALANLVDKGAAYLIEDKANRYIAVAINEFCTNHIRKLEKIKEKLVENMPDRQEDTGGYITIKGKKNIINKMKNLIHDAQDRIYLSLREKTIKEILPELKSAIAKGLKVVIISNPTFNLKGATIYHHEKKADTIRLITDSNKVLTGDILKAENSTCLYSQKQNLVDLFKESMQNEIKVIELRKD
ncbi:TrmB family transcriptional regulator [Natronospora cellulosivora (SeqCode)]